MCVCCVFVCVLCVCVCVCVCRIIENLLSKREKKKFVDTILEELVLSHDSTRLQERYARISLGFREIQRLHRYEGKGLLKL